MSVILYATRVTRGVFPGRFGHFDGVGFLFPNMSGILATRLESESDPAAMGCNGGPSPRLTPPLARPPGEQAMRPAS